MYFLFYQAKICEVFIDNDFIYHMRHFTLNQDLFQINLDKSIEGVCKNYAKQKEPLTDCKIKWDSNYIDQKYPTSGTGGRSVKKTGRSTQS